MGRFESRSNSKVLGRPMYLILRDPGFDRPLYKYHVPQRGEIQFPAKTPSPGMLFTDIGAHAGCYTLLGAEELAFRSSVKVSA